MIQSLHIQNIVLIEDLTISFHSGMHVLTGETGAGKSIVVDALNLILGNRSDRGLIRAGCEKACVEAVFDVPCNHDIEKILDREKIEFDGSTVSIYREISLSGKNLCRICGMIVSVSLLKEIGTFLVDIHGQHDHQFLMNPDMHMQFLDRMGDSFYFAQEKKTAQACYDFLETHRKYARLRRANDEKQHRMNELEKALEELHLAKLKADEEEPLKEEILRLRNSEKIKEALRNSRDLLSVSENEQSALEKVKAAGVNLFSIVSFSEHINKLSEQCQSAYYELEEIVFELNSLIENDEGDPFRLEKLESRLDLIRRLERKYGENLSNVLEEQKRMEVEYEQLCQLEDEITETAQTHKHQLAVYRQEAKLMTEMRMKLAAQIENKILEQLRQLGMEKTCFHIYFSSPEGNKKPMPKPQGDDQLEFMLSPNPGEPLKPLSKVASGGELSRIMLAFKAIESEGSGVNCMVFDEIDTGISGRMAQVVAEKMVAISRSKQVICVSHLPQIAAAADHHYYISKNAIHDKTVTSVQELDREGRIHEVARMVSGAEGSGADAEAYASTMIASSERIKNVKI